MENLAGRYEPWEIERSRNNLDSTDLIQERRALVCTLLVCTLLVCTSLVCTSLVCTLLVCNIISCPYLKSRDRYKLWAVVEHTVTRLKNWIQRLQDSVPRQSPLRGVILPQSVLKRTTAAATAPPSGERRALRPIHHGSPGGEGGVDGSAPPALPAV